MSSSTPRTTTPQPGRHAAPAAGTPYSRGVWVAVAVGGAGAGAVAHLAWARAGSLGGTGAGLATVTLLALLAVAGLSNPSTVTLAGAVLLALAATGTAAALVDAAGHGTHPGDRVVPLALLALAGAVAGPAGLLLGGRRSTQAQRVGVLLGLGMLVALASMPLSGA